MELISCEPVLDDTMHSILYTMTEVKFGWEEIMFISYFKETLELRKIETILYVFLYN